VELRPALYIVDPMSSSAAATTRQEDQLLAAARGGGTGAEEAYRRLVEPRRGELQAHCYRMLGSVSDAEDALQEALLRAWRGMSRFEGRSSFRSWLYRIATNTCLDAVARRPKRVLPIDYGPSADPHQSPGEPIVESVWVEPYADERLGLETEVAGPEARYEQREAVELAFVAALQHLPANQRAVLILREVLGFSAQEVADLLETSVASVNSALQRAREGVDRRLPRESQQANLRSLGDERLGEIVAAYTDAIQRGDVDAVVGMLSEDATWSMPPMPVWYRGREAVAAFLGDYPLREKWRHIPTRANGQLAVGCYMWDDEREIYAAAVLDVISLEGDRIRDVTGFVAPWVSRRFGGTPGTMTPAAFRRFGLAEEWPGAPAPGE
jgi:RNA polymerase sigma-70 factor (ECF subfamily)